MSGTEPLSPVDDDELWIDTTANEIKVRTAGAWAVVSSVSGSASGLVEEQAFGSGSWSLASTFDVAIPATVTDGNLLVVVVSVSNNVSVSQAGWTLAFPASGGSLNHVFYRTAASEPASYTFTLSSSTRGSWFVYELSGADAASMLTSQNQDLGAVNTITVPAIDVPSAGALMLVAASLREGGQTFTWPTDYVQDALETPDSFHTGGSSARHDVAAGSTGDLTVGASFSEDMGVIAVCIPPS